MKLNFKNIRLTYRKLKLSDYHEFNKLFYNCFSRKVSYDFFKSRYFFDKFSFCYGAFKSSKLIANIGLHSMRLNNYKKERIFSRHSSMVLKNFRGAGIFSNLQEIVKRKIVKKYNIVAMWPNKNNYANFGIDKRKIITHKLYLYKVLIKKTSLKKTKNFRIEELVKLKRFIKSNNNLFLKNFSYLNYRYLSYQKHDYFINRFVFKKIESFFILKRNRDNSGTNYVILDHFGSEKIKSKHLSNLIQEQNKLLFLSKKKFKKKNIKLINYLNFKIGFIKRFNLKQKNNLIKKEVYLGDTDIFFTTEKKK